MITPISVNCDMGEGMPNDAALMPFIDAANIACGYHAGDASTMKATMELCLHHGVTIGAHISFLDRANFGRTEMKLSASELQDIIFRQLDIACAIARDLATKLIHVKPHGALYNISASDPFTACMIAAAVKHFDPNLVLYGLSGSHSIKEANREGLQTASEVFADRTYRDDGSLTPRSQPGALIEDADKMIAQVKQMIHDQTVTSVSGKTITIKADTICIHGDGEHALEFAKAIHEAVKNK